MLTLFLDSSAVVKVYIDETGSNWLRALLDPTAGNTHHVCRITAVEVAAAIARRVSEGSISQNDGRQALLGVRADFISNYQITEVTPLLIERAIDLTQQHVLRGYDAVQLAAAVQLNTEHTARRLGPITFVCSDTSLTTAAQSEGLSTEDPNTHP